MGNFNSTTVNNDIETNILQSASNVCKFEANPSIIKSTFIGTDNITIVNEVNSVGTQCTINNTLDSSVSNVVSNVLSQTASTENGILLPSFGANTNIANINTNVGTTISQLITNTCLTSQDPLIDGVFASGANITVENEVNDTGTLNCAITNIARATVANDISNSVTQAALITNAITTIVTMIVIGVVAVATMKAIFAKKDTPKGKGTGEMGSAIEMATVNKS